MGLSTQAEITTCLPAIVTYINTHVLQSKLAKTWGFVRNIIKNKKDTNTGGNTEITSIIKKAWSYAILNDLRGPSAGIQQQWSNLGAPKGSTYIDSTKWQLLLESNRVGVTLWTGSAQNLYATHSDATLLPSNCDRRMRLCGTQN